MDVDTTISQDKRGEAASGQEPQSDGLNSLGTVNEQQPLANAKILEASSIEDSVEKNSFKSRIAQYQAKLDSDFDNYVAQRAASPAQDNELQDLDWDELERRYTTEMGSQIAVEHDITKELSERFQQFSLWMRVSDEKEAERALKRLRTRIAFVHNSEIQLAAKQEHYAKVLSAFQDAMALLGSL